ncbi:MAG: J domain-containing protein, partial [Clostridium sp.]
MSIWGILGIEPTNDIRAIKRAYAKKLKVTHPDDDLEAFQALKEAFDAALSYANNSSYKEDIYREDEYFKVDEEHEEKIYEEYDESYNNLNKEIDENHNDSYEEYEDNYNILNDEHNIGNEDTKDYNRKKEEEYEDNSGSLEAEDDFKFSKYNEESSELSFTYFTEEVNRIYNDFNLRIDILRWESLLNSNLTWNVTDFNEYQKFLLNFIVERHKFIPHYVISLILRYFSVDASCLEESDFFNKSIDKKYLRQVFKPPAFSFSSLEKLDDKERERFLENIYDAYINIINGRYVFARMKIRNCKKILKNNADLILLETFIFLKGYKYFMFKPKFFGKKKYMKASMEINRVIELDKYNPTARLFRLSITQALRMDIIASDIDIAENGDTYLLSKEYVLG